MPTGVVVISDVAVVVGRTVVDMQCHQRGNRLMNGYVVVAGDSLFAVADCFDLTMLGR